MFDCLYYNGIQPICFVVFLFCFVDDVFFILLFNGCGTILFAVTLLTPHVRGVSELLICRRQTDRQTEDSGVGGK